VPCSVRVREARCEGSAEGRRRTALLAALRGCPVRPPHGDKWLTAILVEAAGSVGRTKDATIRRPARPSEQSPWVGPGAGCGSALDPGHGLLDADPRPDLSGSRPGLARPPERRGPRPAVGRPIGTPRPHRGRRPVRLSWLRKNCPSTGLAAHRGPFRLRRRFRSGAGPAGLCHRALVGRLEAAVPRRLLTCRFRGAGDAVTLSATDPGANATRVSIGEVTGLIVLPRVHLPGHDP
jgi:hypothetical protein